MSKYETRLDLDVDWPGWRCNGFLGGEGQGADGSKVVGFLRKGVSSLGGNNPKSKSPKAASKGAGFGSTNFSTWTKAAICVAVRPSRRVTKMI
jgi:hypothetical protein